MIVDGQISGLLPFARSFSEQARVKKMLTDFCQPIL
jgi:hypothetical protein